MFKKIIRKSPVVSFLFFFKKNPYDVFNDPNDGVTNSNNTGIERLKNLFRPYNDDAIHPMTLSIAHMSLGAFLVGGIYGGITTSRDTFINFIETNQATQFKSHLDAKRKLSDKMFLSFARGFGKWGMKISFFSTSFVAAYTLSMVYFDNYSVFNYIFGGTFAGALYKASLGLKGMVSGAFFGSFFGSLYGFVKILLFKITDLSEKALIDKKYEMKKSRKESIDKARQQYEFEKAQAEYDKMLKDN